MSIQTWKQRLRGVFSFPVTPFRKDLSLDIDGFCANIDRFCNTELAAIFVCCGTGEFHALSVQEYATLVREAKQVAGDRKPLLAGAGMGPEQAVEFARAAEQAGAEGILVTPPYLITPEPAGLLRYYQRIATATDLAVILYQRGNAVIDEQTLGRLAELPNIIGFKDGLGNIEHLRRLTARYLDRFAWMSGMPTAEASFEAFYACGVDSFSSAIANFAPQRGLKFHAATVAHDREACTAMLRELVIPICRIRDRRRGYAVSFVKSAMNLMRLPAGPVRPPLINMTPQDEADLAHVLRECGILNR